MAVDSQDPEILATLDRDAPWSCCQHLCVMASLCSQKYGLVITAYENHGFPLIFGRLQDAIACHHQDSVNPMLFATICHDCILGGG